MTLKEIAAELNVSPSIISRVLNGYTQSFSITDELRQRILKKVEECGYRPNPVFSAIKQKKLQADLHPLLLAFPEIHWTDHG